jgi:hypothetical protein
MAMTRMRTRVQAGVPCHIEIVAGVESGLAAACFHGDAWAFDQLLPVLSGVATRGAVPRAVVAARAAGGVGPHAGAHACTELLRRLVALRAPVEKNSPHMWVGFRSLQAPSLHVGRAAQLARAS